MGKKSIKKKKSLSMKYNLAPRRELGKGILGVEKTVRLKL